MARGLRISTSLCATWSISVVLVLLLGFCTFLLMMCDLTVTAGLSHSGNTTSDNPRAEQVPTYHWQGDPAIAGNDARGALVIMQILPQLIALVVCIPSVITLELPILSNTLSEPNRVLPELLALVFLVVEAALQAITTYLYYDWTADSTSSSTTHQDSSRILTIICKLNRACTLSPLSSGVIVVHMVRPAPWH